MWEIGDNVVENYRVLDVLGAGGMATTYKVESQDLREAYAVKVAHPHLIRTAAHRALLNAEIQHWLSLPEHPNLVHCHFVREVDQTPIIFAEFLSGGTLADRIKEAPLSVEEALRRAIEISNGMVMAHASGIVHRDLKPSNCLVGSDDITRVSDFGLATARARLAGSEGRGGLTAMSPSYCAPEQFDNALITAATDVWSFAVLLFELLTATRPGLGIAAPYLVQQFMQSDRVTQVPIGALQLIRGCLVDQHIRPSSFSELKNMLVQVYRESTGKEFRTTSTNCQTDGDDLPCESTVFEASLDLPKGNARVVAQALLKNAYRRSGLNAADVDEFEPESARGGKRERVEALAVIGMLREAEKLHDSLDPTKQDDAAKSERYVVQFLTARMHQQTGDQLSAVNAFRRAARLVTSADEWTLNIDRNLVVLETTVNQAICLRQMNKLQEAIEAYDVAWKLIQQNKNLQSNSITASTACQNRAMALLMLQRLPEALESINFGLNCLPSSLDSRKKQIFAASVYGDRGVIHRQMGNASAAIADYEKSESLYRAGPLKPLDKQANLALTLLNMSAAKLHQQKHAEAEDYADQAVKLLTRLVDEHSMESQMLRLSQAYNNRSQARLAGGDFAGAASDGRQCTELRRKVVIDQGRSQHATDLAKAYINEMVVHVKQNRFHRAVEVGQRATETFEHLSDRQSSPETACVFGKLRSQYAYALVEIGRSKEAVTTIAETLTQLNTVVDSRGANAISTFCEAIMIGFRIAGNGHAELFGEVNGSIEKLVQLLDQRVRLAPDSVALFKGMQQMCRMGVLRSPDGETERLIGKILDR